MNVVWFLAGALLGLALGYPSYHEQRAVIEDMADTIAVTRRRLNSYRAERDSYWRQLCNLRCERAAECGNEPESEGD